MSEENETTPAEGAEEPQEPQPEIAAIQWTGDNLKDVRGLLADAYDRTRGGLQQDDPIVVWFRANPDAPIEAREQALGRAYPGDWIVRGKGEHGLQFIAMPPKEFEKWMGNLGSSTE